MSGRAAPASKYSATKAQAAEASQSKVSPERLLETHISIEGVAPSDLQVATYIKQLSSSSLLDHVTLVESKEEKIDDTTFRKFKLTAMLGKDVHLTSEDVEGIRAKCQKGAYRYF